MIAFLEGTVVLKSSTGVVLNVSGVGYELLMSASSVALLPAEGSRAHVIT